MNENILGGLIVSGFIYLVISSMHTWSPPFEAGERLVNKGPTKDARLFLRFMVFWFWPLLYAWPLITFPFRLFRGVFHILKGGYELIPKPQRKPKVPQARVISK